MSHPTADKVVEVSDVSFRYQAQSVLENICLTIRTGDYLGMIGPNGGGKTTLLKLMLGLLPLQTGSVRLFGIEIARFKDWSKIGYVPQRAIQFDARFPVTVAEVVEMGRCNERGLGHVWKRDHAKHIDEALEQVGMLGYKHRLIGELSSGQQQRVFIARALVSHPRILFLDEPTVGVDVKTQEQFYTLLKMLHQDQGLTLVMVSHDIDVVASQASAIACVNGRLTCHSSPRGEAATAFIKELYGKHSRHIHHDH